MAGIDEVLERLVAEPEFREQLRADPAAALSGYVLDDEDLEVLALTLDESEGGDHAVEQRTSKSALVMLLAAGLDVASAEPPASGPGVPTPYPNIAAVDGAEEADILVGKITPKGDSNAAATLDPAQLGLDPAHMSLDLGEAPADHIETYPVDWGTRVGAEGQADPQPDPKLVPDVEPEAANITDPRIHVQQDAEEVADSHDRYANQEVSYLLQPGDDTAANEAHEGHMEVPSTGSSTDEASGEGAAAKDGTISIEGKDVTVKGRTHGDPPIEEGADDLADGGR